MLTQEWIQNGNYHQTLNDMQYACDNPYEYTILSYLIRCSNNSDAIYPSLTRLQFNGMMSRHTVIKALTTLEQKQFIEISRVHEKPNTYKVNFDNIRHAIVSRLPMPYLSKLASKQLKESQRDKIALDRVLSKQELTDKVINLTNGG